jgi:phosphopantetheinyl transferase
MKKKKKNKETLNFKKHEKKKKKKEEKGKKKERKRLERSIGPLYSLLAKMLGCDGWNLFFSHNQLLT